jgi:hypothetical protein
MESVVEGGSSPVGLPTEGGKIAFPVKPSGNGRYFVDRNGESVF